MNYILTMVIMLAGPGTPSTGNAVTSLTAEYRTLERCERAIETNRQRISQARVLLATCTEK
jgi:hypothetical protein